MKYLSLLACILISLTIAGQHDHVCGNSVEDQLLAERIAAEAGASKMRQATRQEGVNIPIKFHIVTKGDGSGGVKQSALIKQLCKLNQDFESVGMHFYQADGNEYNIIRNSTAYTDPRTGENFLASKKDNAALNVFVVGDIGASQGGPGTVLGYYSPSNDLIVCKIAEVNGISNTLSHEVGHFFSLRHTFFGWECDPYDVTKHGNPVNITSAPCANVPVEVVQRTNCTNAADELCDTPPDYNFGITALGANCSFSLNLQDRNGDRVVPMKENQMSYFSSCASYMFTEDQADRMMRNYNNASRDYIKRNFMPSMNDLSNAPNFINPSGNVTSPFHNYFDFKWEEVPGAEYYLLELEGIGYDYYYTTEPGIIIQNMEKNSIYFCMVHAFNSGDYCLESSNRVRIITDAKTTDTRETSLLSSMTLYPNPAQNMVTVQVNAIKSMDVELILLDITGKVVMTEHMTLQAGSNLQRLDIAKVHAGIHILQMKTDDGSIQQRLTIVK